MSYISNRLTHWAGRNQGTPESQYDLFINQILVHKRLLYSRCPQELGSKYGGVKDYTIPMICFTDIPFSECEGHCKSYSMFGLAFSKRYLANCLASPVGYVQSPLVHQAYSYIHHGLLSLKDNLEKLNQPTWTKRFEETGEERLYSVDSLRMHFRWMTSLLEDYSAEEFLYNENQPEPLESQADFFDKPDVKYFEREWRMIPESGFGPCCWETMVEGKLYFSFNERFLEFVILPKFHVDRFKSERDRIFANYAHQPQVLSFEDLRFL